MAAAGAARSSTATTAGYLSTVSYAALTFSKSCALSTCARASAIAAVTAPVTFSGSATALARRSASVCSILNASRVALSSSSFSGVSASADLAYATGAEGAILSAQMDWSRVTAVSTWCDRATI